MTSMEHREGGIIDYYRLLLGFVCNITLWRNMESDLYIINKFEYTRK